MLTVIKALLLRGMQIVLVALIVMIGTNLLMRLVPGDPARTILGDKASPEALSALRDQLGLDAPIFEQVGRSMVGLLHGDLGTSFAYRGQDVTSIIGPSLVVTGSLAAVAIVFSLLAGIPFGLGLALVPSSGADLIGPLVTAVLLALPSFVAGLALLYVVSLQFGLAPAGGWPGVWPANLEYLWLPAAALSLYLGSLIARTVRQAALDALGQPFVEAARTRGVGPGIALSLLRTQAPHPGAVIPPQFTSIESSTKQTERRCMPARVRPHFAAPVIERRYLRLPYINL